MTELEKLIAKARKLSWQKFGKRITFYHPGMFCYNGKWGKYPGVSITGKYCELQCDHCRAKLLEPMIFATTPEELISKGKALKKEGNIGLLITGGSYKDGTLPWNNFIPAIKTLKEKTNFFLSIHSGIIDFRTAKKLKDAGIEQALIDVIGDAETFKKVYHLDFGISKIEESLDALSRAGIPIIPHIVVGLEYGKIRGEYNAIQMIKKYSPEAVVIVSLMPLSDTPMQDVLPPKPQDIARIIATARIEMPNTIISLGCARERGNARIDVLAVDSGINRMALPSEEAIKRAKEYKLDMEWEDTCCSVSSNLLGGVN